HVPLTLDRFAEISARTPLLADVKPFGQHVMRDVDHVGGIPVVMRVLLDAGLLHGDALTVTGRTVAENLAHIDPPLPDGHVLYGSDRPYRTTGGLAVLRGSLAPDGAVAKAPGFSYQTFRRPARVNAGEPAALAALAAGVIEGRCAISIRQEERPG